MIMAKRNLFLLLILCCIVVNAQTLYLKGAITLYDGGAGMKAHVAQFDGTGFTEVASALIDSNGGFAIYPSEKLSPSACLLWFDSGDTVSFIAGDDKFLEFTGRLYEHMIVGPRFINSKENDLFRSVKNKVSEFHSIEDSINRSGRAIDEFDPMYSGKAAAIKEYFLVKVKEYNNQLKVLQNLMPESYCSKAIIPVLFQSNMDEDTLNLAKNYDNNRAFQHYEFFSRIGNDSLISTNPFLREKIYSYMNIWVNQQDKRLQDGIDVVMKKFSPDDALRKYALSTLVDYFTGHNNFPLVNYLYENYFNTCGVPALKGKSAEVIEQIKRLSRGNKAPDLIMPDIHGNYFWLSQMKPRRYVVLFFWASWCPHCQKLMPDILNYYHDVKDKGVDFVAVSLDNNKQEWLDYVSQNKLDWINISDLRRFDSEAISLYALKGTPTFFVLDKSLNIVGSANELSGLKALIK
jgi:thiol-disulfide isomerase/thioredoxin